MLLSLLLSADIPLYVFIYHQMRKFPVTHIGVKEIFADQIDIYIVFCV
jgi:hypothetical protein